MAVPQQRKSRAKSRSRRAANMKYQRPYLSWCNHCGAPKLPHRVCRECGYYKGRLVLRVIE
jgi:large subunit ribosomal protein L32